MSNIGGGARNHHFVPQFYLKGFAKPRSKDGRLFVCDMKERRRFQTRPRNVAAKRDFNRVEAEHLDPNIVESQLGTVEAEFDRAFKRIIDAQSIASRDDFSAVLGLLARLFIAHPKFRNQRETLMSDVAQMMMQNMVASKERWDAVEAQGQADGAIDSPIPFEEAKAMVEQGLIVPRVNKDVLIAQEFELWPTILPMLERRNWSLFIASPEAGDFATSDRPCTLRWSDPGTESGMFGPGLGVGGTSIIFPISRNLAIEGRYERGGGTMHATPELVAAVNIATLTSTMRQVYSAEDFPITDLDGTIRPFSQSEFWLERICNRPPDTEQALEQAEDEDA